MALPQASRTKVAPYVKVLRLFLLVTTGGADVVVDRVGLDGCTTATDERVAQRSAEETKDLEHVESSLT